MQLSPTSSVNDMWEGREKGGGGQEGNHACAGKHSHTIFCEEVVGAAWALMASRALAALRVSSSSSSSSCPPGWPALRSVACGSCEGGWEERHPLVGLAGLQVPPHHRLPTCTPTADPRPVREMDGLFWSLRASLSMRLDARGAVALPRGACPLLPFVSAHGEYQPAAGK